MKANEIRQKFFDFFEDKKHKIVQSAPIVLKDDPTLMFTNAGMNQFKDLFMGYKEAEYKRIADTQKCLRVSGKHNDLEEVGRDSYHHTMFEMLGNWSVGDYFKSEAIKWAWELLVEVYKLDPTRLYATVFEGDKEDGLQEDKEAFDEWKKFLPEDRILYSSKKDNFWEMGDTGPCGPCSELHYDMRSDEDRSMIPGRTLVNQDDPFVIEIWNLVFMQFNRKANGKLEELPAKHIDTGMGFERLCMALQGKTSNYDTDVFAPFIRKVEQFSGIEYTGKYDDSSMTDIAMRVAVDHIRAVSFTIADGELPSNSGAGYVIRRILRRAVRYNYSFLNQESPMMYKLVDPLSTAFKDVFPELFAQKDFIEKVILEEEKSFLRTLNSGLKRLENIQPTQGVISGKDAFELYDTYGFPIDLTRLIAAEKSLQIDEDGFTIALEQQKERGRKDAQRDTGDWNIVHEGIDVDFVGYDQLTVDQAKVLSWREINQKGKTLYQIVLNKTPFYAEGGGQVGDKGILSFDEEIIPVFDTKKENDLIIHYTSKLPSDLSKSVRAEVNQDARRLTENNHSATHLLHAALREVLGDHVQQKGSLVKPEGLRFDISHFQKITDEQITQVEQLVNQKIRANIVLNEQRSISLEEAKSAGAMMLFGEKYGDKVRMITFDSSFSSELCGGCHVKATGQIGQFKITSEGAVAAGVRRLEAVTSIEAERYIEQKLNELKEIKALFKTPKNTVGSIKTLQEEHKTLSQQIERLKSKAALSIKADLEKRAIEFNDFKAIIARLEDVDSKSAKNLAYSILQNASNNTAIIFGLESNNKPQLMVALSEDLTDKIHAGKMVKNLSSFIKGGGGGQAFFATAGGSDASGLDSALEEAKKVLSDL